MAGIDEPVENPDIGKAEYPYEFEFELDGFSAKAVGKEPITTEQKAWLIETVTNRFTKSRDAAILDRQVVLQLIDQVAQLKGEKNG